jgi:perosamine synthetase
LTKQIPFSRPCFTDNDLNEITIKIREVLRSGWLTSGPVVRQFEDEFASFIGTKYAIAINSCTAALHSILLALGIGNGDEVIVPTNTFVATANAVLYVGAKPIFADSDPETFNVSPKDIDDKISKKTKAIIVVHLGGNPCDMDEICRIAKENNLVLIEDCAHAHGAKYRGKSCGTFGIASAFSFYPTKIITAGEGGMVTTDDQGLVKKIGIIRNHGRASYGPAKIIDLGFNYRLSDINAVVGLSQMKHLDEYVKNRNFMACFYNNELSAIEWLTPQKIKEGNLSSYYVYIVKVEDSAPITRDKLMLKLKEKGVGTSILYDPIHLQPFYSKLFRLAKETLPIAEDLGKQALALPLFSCMPIDDAKYVVEKLKQLYREI